MKAKRLAVRKTSKLFVGGASPRSENGRVLPAIVAMANYRERVPGFQLSSPPALFGVRDTFADIAATIAVPFHLATKAGAPHPHL